MREGVRVVASEFVREPVKDAVREALREEGVTASPAGGKPVKSSERGREESSSAEGGGPSGLTVVAVLVAVAGVAYLARRRMSSTTGSAWSEPSPGAVAEEDAEGGYASEGEMQTAETADDSDGTSPATDE